MAKTRYFILPVYVFQSFLLSAGEIVQKLYNLFSAICMSCCIHIGVADRKQLKTVNFLSTWQKLAVHNFPSDGWGYNLRQIKQLLWQDKLNTIRKKT